MTIAGMGRTFPHQIGSVLLLLTGDPVVCAGLGDGLAVLVGHPEGEGDALQHPDGELVRLGVTHVDYAQPLLHFETDTYICRWCSK